MQLYVFFSTHLLPRILNDTLHCRPVAEIVEYTYLVGKVPFGVQGQSPGGGLGAKPPEAERFFLFQRVILALNRGGAATISGGFKGGGGRAAAARPSHLQGRPIRGAAAPRPLLDPSLNPWED